MGRKSRVLSDLLSDTSLSSRTVRRMSWETVTLGKHVDETRVLAVMFTLHHTIFQMRGYENVEQN